MTPAEALDVLALPMTAGAAVLLTHVPLGQAVLQRGIVFMDLAVAQVAGLGALAAGLVGWEGLWGKEVGSLLFALAGATALWRGERLWRGVEEAVIGSVFVLAACASLLLMAKNPHGMEHMEEVLAGQILWMTQEKAFFALGASAVLLPLCWRKSLSEPHSGGLFYLVFALAVTISVQLVGVYLVFASLIFPALASRKRRFALGVGYACGFMGYALGMFASVWLDLPTGPAIVWALALCALGLSLRQAPP